jgi:hypothetical protein
VLMRSVVDVVDLKSIYSFCLLRSDRYFQIQIATPTLYKSYNSLCLNSVTSSSITTHPRLQHQTSPRPKQTRAKSLFIYSHTTMTSSTTAPAATATALSSNTQEMPTRPTLTPYKGLIESEMLNKSFVPAQRKLLMAPPSLPRPSLKPIADVLAGEEPTSLALPVLLFSKQPPTVPPPQGRAPVFEPVVKGNFPHPEVWCPLCSWLL